MLWVFLSLCRRSNQICHLQSYESSISPLPLLVSLSSTTLTTSRLNTNNGRKILLAARFAKTMFRRSSTSTHSPNAQGKKSLQTSNNIMKKFFIVMGYMVGFLSLNLYGQKTLYTGEYEGRGYFVYVWDNIYFQPCEDSTVALLDGLNSSAFFIDPCVADISCYNIPKKYNLGDSIIVNLLNLKNMPIIDTSRTIYYYYSYVKLQTLYYAEEGNKPKNKGRVLYQLKYDNIHYNFMSNGFFSAVIIDIYPYNKKVREIFKQFYTQNHMKLPQSMK